MLLEVCVETARGLAAAVQGGADRIELCTALSVGGLTPPGSLIRIAAAAPCPVHLLARPREGNFVHDAAEASQVADDMTAAAEAGLAGVVIGASAGDRRLDQPLLARWIDHARMLGAARGQPLSLTLHRAFDLAPDLGEALEAAIALGFDRVLTSGGEPRAVDGCAALARLHAQAADRIVILAGSGIDTATLPAILATGVREVHASCRIPRTVAADTPEYRFGFVGHTAAETDPARVTALVTALRDAA